MIEFYAQIKWVHVTAVLCSGSLFLLRGLMLQCGRTALARAAALRYLSYTIDSVLLTAALMLFTMLPAVVFGNGWLAAKLVLLVLYVALGIAALRADSSPRRSRVCFLAALVVFGTMFSIARTHHPLGLLLRWFS